MNILNNMKKEFIIYTDDITINSHGLGYKGKTYKFNNDGTLLLNLRPKTHKFICVMQEIVYDFIDENRIYYIYREDNDCHFVVLIKDISKEEYYNLRKKYNGSKYNN